MRPCELNDIANLSTAGQGTMSRAGLGGRSVDTSPVQGRATQVPALLGMQGSPAMPCYVLLCPASAKSLSEKRREHVRERDRVSWLNPLSHTSSSEDVHRAQTRLQRSQKKVSLELVFQSKRMWSNKDCSLIGSSEKNIDYSLIHISICQNYTVCYLLL